MLPVRIGYSSCCVVALKSHVLHFASVQPAHSSSSDSRIDSVVPARAPVALMRSPAIASEPMSTNQRPADLVTEAGLTPVSKATGSVSLGRGCAVQARGAAAAQPGPGAKVGPLQPACAAAAVASIHSAGWLSVELWRTSPPMPPCGL